MANRRNGWPQHNRHCIRKNASSQIIERDGAQWLERGALAMSLPAVRFRILFGAGFSEKYHVSPLSILGHCFNTFPLGKALKHQKLHLTQVRMSTS